MGERERHIFLAGRLVFSFGKNGQGLSDEFDIINQVTKLLSPDNFITIHKTFIDQPDDVYDIVFDVQPRMNVDYLIKDDEVGKVAEHGSQDN